MISLTSVVYASVSVEGAFIIWVAVASREDVMRSQKF